MQSYAEGKEEESHLETKAKKMVEFIQIGLRVSALVTSIAATSIVFTSKQTTLVFGIQMDAKYTYSSAFK